MTRDDLRNLAISFIKETPRVALSWATSVGKSAAALAMANYCLRDKDNGNVLIVVAETAHKSNWKEQINSWGLKKCNCTIVCYASLHNCGNTLWDVIIYDEAHHLKSDKRLSSAFFVKGQAIILLSATLPYTTLSAIEAIYGKFVSHKVSLQEAIDSSILPEPEVHILALELEDRISNCIITEKASKDIKDPIYLDCTYNQRWQFKKELKKVPNAILRIKCTQKEKYQYYDEKFEYWKEQTLNGTGPKYSSNLMRLAGAERKRVLGEAKTTALLKLLPRLKNRRYICFCSSIDQADMIGGSNVVHSKIKNRLKILEDFNQGKRDKLFVVSMLQEGMNLAGIETAVITQLDGVERGFIQKAGRGMRAQHPEIYVLYFKNTRDEAFLQNVIEGVDQKYLIYEDNTNVRSY